MEAMGRERTRQIEESAHCNSGDIEVPSSDWASFVDSFSRQHEGWLASISESRGREKVVGVADSRLQSITLLQSDEKSQLDISLLPEDGEQVLHSVPEPIRLIFKQDAHGAHQGLEVTSQDGRITTLRFRVASHPEMLDGILPDFAH